MANNNYITQVRNEAGIVFDLHDNRVDDLDISDAPATSGDRTSVVLSPNSWEPGIVRFSQAQEDVNSLYQGDITFSVRGIGGKVSLPDIIEPFSSVDDLYVFLSNSTWTFKYNNETCFVNQNKQTDCVEIASYRELNSHWIYGIHLQIYPSGKIEMFADSSGSLTYNSVDIKNNKLSLSGQKYNILNQDIKTTTDINFYYSAPYELYSIGISAGKFIIGCKTQPSIPIEAQYKAIETSGNGMIYISNGYIPTKTSQLQNDSGYITLASIPTNISSFTNDSGYITQSDIPVNVSSFTNDSGYITLASIPTNISSFVNDSGYLTLADLPIYNGGVS